MEIVKYLCEFFFDDFWHWLGLIILVDVIPVIRFVSVNSKKKEDEE